MPQPLSHIREQVGYNLNNVGDYVLREREALARSAMEGIASFATVESWMLGLFIDLIGGNKTDAATVFLTLESRGARSAALAPFVARLEPRYQELYQAIMHRMKICAKERDNLAHWVWGASQQLPDALLLANPKALAVLDFASPTYSEDIAREIWVYRVADFTQIIENNNALANAGFKFRWIVQGHISNREDQLYHELCAEPVLADILRRRAERARPQHAAGQQPH